MVAAGPYHDKKGERAERAERARGPAFPKWPPLKRLMTRVSTRGASTRELLLTIRLPSISSICGGGAGGAAVGREGGGGGGGEEG